MIASENQPEQIAANFLLEFLFLSGIDYPLTRKANDPPMLACIGGFFIGQKLQQAFGVCGLIFVAALETGMPPD